MITPPRPLSLNKILVGSSGIFFFFGLLAVIWRNDNISPIADAILPNRSMIGSINSSASL